jgi:hypothetical protein
MLVNVTNAMAQVSKPIRLIRPRTGPIRIPYCLYEHRKTFLTRDGPEPDRTVKTPCTGWEARLVAGGPARVAATPCWRPTFQPPRGRERRNAGGRPWSSCHCLAASTVRSTHHLHLGRADTNVIRRGMAALAVLVRCAAIPPHRWEWQLKSQVQARRAIVRPRS